LFGGKKENDELYQIIAILGLPKSYVANLPEDYFDKVYQLARIFRIIQNAYSGKKINQKYLCGMSQKPHTFLKLAVPSMRALRTIMEDWRDDGYERDLDFYLWKHFIQRFEAEEQEWVYLLFNTFGGFFLDKTMKTIKKDGEEKDILEDNGVFKIGELNLTGSIPKNPAVPRKKTNRKTFSQQELLENLFGVLPKVTEKDLKRMENIKPEIDLEQEKGKLIDTLNSTLLVKEENYTNFLNETMKKYCKEKCGL